MVKYGKRVSVADFVARLKKSLVIDGRYGVLEFEENGQNFHVLTDSVPTAAQLSRLYQESRADFRIKVTLLPDSSVGGNKYGVCHVGVAPIRRTGSSTSEQVTQILYGETFEVLQLVGTWARVRLLADGYLGWVSANQVTLFDETGFDEYCKLPKIYAASHVVRILSKPNGASVPIREAVYGSQLSARGKHGRFFEIKLPDGAIGYVERSRVNVRQPEGSGQISPANLFRTAGNFLGISYLWGGRSTKGFDCSGFVQTVFRLNGIELPRDADTQFSAGKPLGKDIGALRPGDLLFFSSNGDKITHVAIYMGKNSQFIHSSGYVRINSFDSRRKNYSEKLLSSFVGACRII